MVRVVNPLPLVALLPLVSLIDSVLTSHGAMAQDEDSLRCYPGSDGFVEDEIPAEAYRMIEGEPDLAYESGDYVLIRNLLKTLPGRPTPPNPLVCIFCKHDTIPQSDLT